MQALLTRINVRSVARTALVFGACYGLWWLLWQARSGLTPFIFGLVLAYVFQPFVNRFAHRMPRWTAIVLVYVLVLALVITFFAFLVPPLAEQLGQLIGAMPDLPMLQGWANALIKEYDQLVSNLPETMRVQVQQTVAGIVSQAVNTLRTNFITYLQGLGTFVLDSVLSVANTVSFLLGFFLIPFWLFYVLLDQQVGRDRLDQMLPRWLRADFWSVVAIVDYDFSGYLRGQLLLGLVVGGSVGLGLATLNLLGIHVPYVLLLAVFAGITELIPIIGPIIGSIPAIILGFIDSPTNGIAVLLMYLAIQQLENNFLVPRIVGDSVGLHPSILMVLLVVCSTVFGVTGAILSAPLGAVSRDVFTYLYGRLSEPPQPAGLMPPRLRREPTVHPPVPPAPSPPPQPDANDPPPSQ